MIAQTKDLAIVGQDDDIMSDETLWDIVASGDLKGLTASQRAKYFLYRCRQEGLNPASQPFTYLVLNGKGILYGNKTAADQLRKVHGISIVDLTFTDDGEYLTYEITMRDRDGRQDMDVGQVFVGTAKGEQRANARMKAITKAKRRATYSICGTGVLDETEVETIPNVQGWVVEGETVDQDTGEITARRRKRLLDADPAPEEITAPSLTLDDDIKRLRMELGWSDAQDVIDVAADQDPPINLSTREGKQAMVDLLQSYVDAVESEWESDQGSFFDAESHVVGEPGLDRNTA